MNRLHFLLLCGLLSCLGWVARAQGFDDLKRAKPTQLNSKLQAAVDKNDARELAKLLKSKPEFKEDGSRMGRNDKGGPLVIPLLYDIVDRTLNGEVSPELCKIALDANCDVYAIYNGKTPIYRIMDYFATTPSVQADVGMEVLNLFLARTDFDINRRYRSLPPPFSYLLSTNYSFLGKRYDKNYLSTELIRSIIDHGGRLNTYDENDASLLLLANSTQNEYLQNFLIDNGVNIYKAADDHGNDAVDAAIESNNTPQLQRLVKNYQIILTTAHVKYHTSRVSDEMYDYLASECANNSTDYNSITDFRHFFSDKKFLVQSKYENLARAEVAKAKDYESIMTCKGRYPDLTDITDPKFNEIASNDLNATKNIVQLKVCEKRYPHLQALIDLKKMAFYHIDVLNLKESFSHAQDLVHIGSFVHEKRMSSYADWFIENYQNYYDPEDQLPLAKDLCQFYSAIEKVKKGYYTTYIKLPSPRIFWEEMNEDLNRLQSAYTSLANCGHGLSSDAMLKAVNQAIDEVKTIADKNIREYREFCEILRKNMKVTKNTGPHGELHGGGPEMRHSEDGKIEIDLGIPYEYYSISVYYNAYYWDNNEFRHYKITNIWGYHLSISYYDINQQQSDWTERYKEYKTSGELERDIVNKIYWYYCSFLK